MPARTRADIARLREAVLRTRRISDDILRLGPFGLGLDGVLAWVPGLGLLYSLGAGAQLLIQARRARAPLRTLASMAGFLVVDSVAGAIPVPFAPAAVDMLFTGHRWAAEALLRAMDETLYYEGSRRQAEEDPELMALLSGPDGHGRRVVHLG